MKKLKLTDQLVIIYAAIITIIIISLGIILPMNLLPIYEENIYNYLKQPLNLVESPADIDTKINSEIAYIYINNYSKDVLVSENLQSIIEYNDINDLLLNTNESEGKFKYNRSVYYYSTISNKNEIKIALTDDSYINSMRQNVLKIIIIIVGITFIIASVLIITWSNGLVNKIKKLKDKIDNIDNDNYDHRIKYNEDDELYSLDLALENMRKYLKDQEEYKNQMYQNISHDFKTPITVIKSYIEASEDGIETKDKTLSVIKEQINKLEIKVHSLLYLNKLNYIKSQKEISNVHCDVSKIIFQSVEKFKIVRPDVEFILDIEKKHNTFRGSVDMWEAIIDNILNNFTRYAKKEIKITIKNNKIILYNDGPNIDKNVLNNIFTPYEKGVKGIFGLGLSIVKKTLLYLEYDITIENEKKGVKFIIN